MFPRTWSEELVAEWLSIKGYFVETNVPAGTGRGGGRKEADVIGFRVENNKAKVVHVEISSLWEGEDAIIRWLQRKFSEERIKEIKGWVRHRADIDEIDYVKLAIIIGSPGVINKVKGKVLDIKVLSFDEFYKNEILGIVKERIRSARTFPDNYWILNLLYSIYATVHKEYLKNLPENCRII